MIFGEFKFIIFIETNKQITMSITRYSLHIILKENKIDLLHRIFHNIISPTFKLKLYSNKINSGAHTRQCACARNQKLCS